MEVSRSAIRVGIGRIAAGVLQTLVIAGGLLFMRSESPAHARRHEETMSTLNVQRRVLVHGVHLKVGGFQTPAPRIPG